MSKAKERQETTRNAKEKPNKSQTIAKGMSFIFFTEMLIVFCCFEALNIKILKFVTSLNVLKI